MPIAHNKWSFMTTHIRVYILYTAHNCMRDSLVNLFFFRFFFPVFFIWVLIMFMWILRALYKLQAVVKNKKVFTISFIHSYIHTNTVRHRNLYRERKISLSFESFFFFFVFTNIRNATVITIIIIYGQWLDNVVFYPIKQWNTFVYLSIISRSNYDLNEIQLLIQVTISPKYFTIDNQF